MIEIMQAVLGAGSRVELHLRCGDATAGRDDLALWQDIEALTDRRLIRRLALSFRGGPNTDLRTLTQRFGRTGWEVRAYVQDVERKPLEFLIVDREHAWVGGAAHSSPQLNRYVPDASSIEGLVSEFRHLWALAVPPTSDLLYVGPSALLDVGGPDWGRLIAELQSHPEWLYTLSPRDFEQLVAELFIRDGYTVTLTPESRDGGRDILVATPHAIGNFLYLVECKRYAPQKKVGVELVRQLYGVVEAERATAGILVTTSSFTAPARQWQRALQSRLSLKDYDALREWMRGVQRPTGGAG